jgi:hypothetical protein
MTQIILENARVFDGVSEECPDGGLALTTQVLGETHLAGLRPSFLSFMRTCWTSPA